MQKNSALKIALGSLLFLFALVVFAEGETNCFLSAAKFEVCTASARNIGIFLFGGVGIYLAWNQLALRSQSLSIDRSKADLERIGHSIDRLESERVSVRLAGLRALSVEVRNSNAHGEVAREAILRFLQEENASALAAARSRYALQSDAEGEEAAYAQWLERPIAAIDPQEFKDFFGPEYQNWPSFSVKGLCFRGLVVQLDCELSFYDCDFSDSKILVDGGCRLVSCDLTRANVILREVKSPRDLLVSHCNLSRARFQPAMPDGYESPRTSRSGWCWQNEQPVVGDDFSFINLNSKPLFSFCDKGGRMVDIESRHGWILGRISNSDLRGFIGILDDDYHRMDYGLHSGEGQ